MLDKMPETFRQWVNLKATDPENGRAIFNALNGPRHTFLMTAGPEVWEQLKDVPVEGLDAAVDKLLGRTS